MTSSEDTHQFAEREVEVSLGQPFIENRCKLLLGPITWLVGPNASGKTKVAEALINPLGGPAKARLLRADRLSGLELHRSGYFSTGQFSQGFQKNAFSNLKNEAQQHGYGADAIVLLEENRALRAIVEATLSQIFGRRVLFEWDSGILEPKVLQKGKGNTYSLHKDECHGLKELVVLLTHLYDPNKEALIVDEPELNLHPQFQSYILEHFQSVTKTQKKRIILITHSPYMLDIKTDEDLRYVYCFNGDGKLPSKISSFAGIDLTKVRRCISQMNAHHRQLFFAQYVAIVEGVYDRLVMAALIDRSGSSMAAAGGAIVDVNGKEDIPFYLRFCEQLGKDVFVFADLDALFDGSIRRILSKDDQLISALARLGGGADIAAYIGTIQRELHDLYERINSLADGSQTNLSRSIKRCLVSANKTDPKVERYLSKLILNGKIESWPQELQDIISSLSGRLKTILSAFMEGLKVKFLVRGELEDYLAANYENKLEYLSDEKQQLAAKALEVLYEAASEPEKDFPNLVDLQQQLKILPQKSSVDYWVPITDVGKEIVQFIQFYATSGDLIKKEDIQRVLPEKFKNINALAELTSYEWSSFKKYAGTIKFSFQGKVKFLKFDQNTPVHEMNLVDEDKMDNLDMS